MQAKDNGFVLSENCSLLSLRGFSSAQQVAVPSFQATETVCDVMSHSRWRAQQPCTSAKRSKAKLRKTLASAFMHYLQVSSCSSKRVSVLNYEWEAVYMVVLQRSSNFVTAAHNCCLLVHVNSGELVGYFLQPTSLYLHTSHLQKKKKKNLCSLTIFALNSYITFQYILALCRGS